MCVKIREFQCIHISHQQHPKSRNYICMGNFPTLPHRYANIFSCFATAAAVAADDLSAECFSGFQNGYLALDAALQTQHDVFVFVPSVALAVCLIAIIFLKIWLRYHMCSSSPSPGPSPCS